MSKKIEEIITEMSESGHPGVKEDICKDAFRIRDAFITSWAASVAVTPDAMNRFTPGKEVAELLRAVCEEVK